MIALLGGSGYVGGAYQTYFQQRGIPYQSLTRAELDYTDLKTLNQWLKQEKPDFLINAAGYTGKPNVDACEADKHNCLFGNAVFPGIVAEACAGAGIQWGQVSSGCIYTGCREDGKGFTEDDKPNFSFRTDNCSFYSGTKALGEEVLKDAENAYVWRLRIPFNHEDSPRNYLSKLMRYARLLEATNSISQLNEFVEATFACFEKQVPFGIYNVTNPGEVTTSEVAKMIEDHGLAPHEFSFFDDEVEFMKKAAITPRSNCVLDASKLENAGIKLTPVREAISQALENWIPEKNV
ncbi:sugar nucleotide-binding protein [Kiritimatiellaeota bacterium B1221]|nr:sugar nucleotide-binding protein [Kiritimatiellaeota bacterium B1221]